MNKRKIVKMIQLKNPKEKKISKSFLTFILLLFVSFFIVNSSSAQSKPWIAPKTADNIKNPLAGNTETLKYAKVIYETYCTPCHGNKGRGDGIAAAGLAIKPADHTSDAVQKQTDGALYWELTQGHSPMPSYKTVLTDNQRWELINYIRTLAKNKK